jgi:hypothetical protein
MDIIFHGSVIIPEHCIDHPVYFEKFFDCIQVSVFYFLEKFIAIAMIQQHDIPDQVFFIGKILVQGFLGDTEMLCHIIHGHTFNTVTVVQPPYLFKNMKGFFFHSTKILKWKGGNYLQRKVFTIFLSRQE